MPGSKSKTPSVPAAKETDTMKAIPHRSCLWSLLVLFACLIWGACNNNERPAPASHNDPKESAMTAANKSLTWPREIPPIDAAAPERFETATFGLG